VHQPPSPEGEDEDTGDLGGRWCGAPKTPEVTKDRGIQREVVVDPKGLEHIDYERLEEMAQTPAINGRRQTPGLPGDWS
jgi:hypothetical protein